MNNVPATPAIRTLGNFPWLTGRLQQAPQSSTQARDGLETQHTTPRESRQMSFLEDLIKQIDMAIYCQISVLCYMDCSLWRFLFRLIPQWILANPPHIFLLAAPIPRSYLTSIVFTNLACAFLHASLDPPSGSELSRGYVHGGFLIDFVGESAPVSRLKMILIDSCIAILQLFMLAAVLQKRSLKLATEDPALLNVLDQLVRPSRAQDVDAEEQGIRRSQEGLLEESTEGEDGPDLPHREADARNESYGGQMVIMTFNLSSTTTQAWKKQYGLSARRSTSP